MQVQRRDQQARSIAAAPSLLKLLESICLVRRQLEHYTMTLRTCELCRDHDVFAVFDTLHEILDAVPIDISQTDDVAIGLLLRNPSVQAFYQNFWNSGETTEQPFRSNI